MPYSTTDLSLQSADDLRYGYGINIIDNDLTYKRSDEWRIKVKVINRVSNGKDYSVTVGDEHGKEEKEKLQILVLKR